MENRDYANPDKQLEGVKVLWSLTYYDYPITFIGEYKGEKVYGCVCSDKIYSTYYNPRTDTYDPPLDSLPSHIVQDLETLDVPLYSITYDDKWEYIYYKFKSIADIISHYRENYSDYTIQIREDVFHEIHRMDAETTEKFAHQQDLFEKYVKNGTDPDEYYNNRIDINIKTDSTTLLGYVKNVYGF